MDFEVDDWNVDNHVEQLDKQLFSPKDQLTVSSLSSKQSKKNRKQKSKKILKEASDKINYSTGLGIESSNNGQLKKAKLKKLKKGKEELKKQGENTKIFKNEKDSSEKQLNKKKKKVKEKIDKEDKEGSESVENIKKVKKKVGKKTFEKNSKKVQSESSMKDSTGDNETLVSKKRKKKKKNSNKKNKYKHLDEERARLKQSLSESSIGATATSTSNVPQDGKTEGKLKKKEGEVGANKIPESKRMKIKRLKTGEHEAGNTIKAIKQNIKSKKRKLESDADLDPGSKKQKIEEETEDIMNEAGTSVKKNMKRNKTSSSNNMKKMDDGKNVEKQQKSRNSVTSPFNVAKLQKVLNKDDGHSTSGYQKDLSNPEQQKKTCKQKWASLSLRDRMMEQLKSARFRFINEKLYTQTGSDAVRLFKEDKESFHCYHEGFQKQVEKWPTNPVDVIIKKIKSCSGSPIIGDFGCGDAKIARSLPNKVHSFDLVALNEHVTVCNIEKVPLKKSSLDIAVFCLSLMGTNLAEYLMEANRVLKEGGTLMIAEVKSRIPKVGKFVRNIEKMGFELSKTDSGNDMFIMLDFTKTGVAGEDIPAIELDPCFYKKR